MKTHKFTVIELLVILMMFIALFVIGTLLWLVYDAAVSLIGVSILCG